MNEGYVVGGGAEYYCTDECLHKNYTPAQWTAMSADQDHNDSNYWTKWEEETTAF